MKATIQSATDKDCKEILEFIRGLAQYEKLEHELVATEESLRETLFGKRPAAEVIFVCDGPRKLGFALFFQSYSTFLAKPGMYLEDLFVWPEFRGQGLGLMLLSHLAKLCVERNLARLEWSVLDWNKPAIDFYLKLGSKPMDEWTVHRVTGDALQALAKRQ